jgi:DNA-binding transcriptional LysR family regulator
MIRFDDLQVFICAVDNGSLSAAARQLDVTPAVASVALKRLENEVGARLLARSTRSLRLTPEGERYAVHARKALAEIQAGHDALAYGRQDIGGNISLSMPSDLGRNVLAPWLDEFQERHQRVTLSIRISDRLTDLFRQPVDVAVRYGIPEDSSLVALPLAAGNRRVLCAAPSYFARYGTPSHPDDLRRHNCLRFSLSDIIHEHWRFHHGEEEVTTAVQGDRVADDGELVHRWALQGVGIAYKSRLDVLGDLRAGRLVTAMEGLVGELAPLHLVCTHRLALSPTINALRNHLRERLERHIAGT